MFTFEHIEYLWILCILPILAGIYVWDVRRRKRLIERFGESDLVSALMPDFSQSRKNLKFILELSAIAMIVIAIAGPRFGSKLTKVKREGIDLIIALDISNSMMAEDIAPNRLERAKQELSRLLDRLDDDRIGLIVFAGDAYTQIPITNDYLSAKMFLSGINTQMISKQGTAIGAAIELAIKSFNPRSKAGKAIVIISDGENHEEGVSEACRKAKQNGIKIFTIGMGLARGERIPLSSNTTDKDYQRDKDGNFVVTKLNEQMLIEIAAAGDGKYYQANTPGLGLNDMLSQFNKMDTAETEYKEYTEFEEQFPPVIWIALVLLCMDLAILSKRNKWFKNIPLFNGVSK